MPEQNVNIGAFKIMKYVYPMWNRGSTAVIEKYLRLVISYKASR